MMNKRKFLGTLAAAAAVALTGCHHRRPHDGGGDFGRGPQEGQGGRGPQGGQQGGRGPQGGPR
jgi:hypothetical protein